MDLSLVVITLNEENEIRRCISSVPFASEVIVVDSGSTDRTVELAEAAGATVLQHPFHSFSSQKQWALERAGSGWVLVLDADESLDPVLAGAIETLISSDPPHSAYRLPFRVMYMGRLMRFGPWSGERHLRLFRRGSAKYTDSGVHEGLAVLSGTTGDIREGMVLHRSFISLDQQCRKMLAYAGMWAEREASAGRRSGYLPSLLRPAWRFFSSYILRGGFLEGFPGLAASAVTSWYIFLKWSMLRELNRRGASQAGEPAGN